MSLTISVHQVDEVRVVKMVGRLVAGQAVLELRDTIRRLIDDGDRSFVLNLAGVSYIDSAGLGQILTTYSAITSHGGRVALLSPSTRTESLLQIAKLVTVFDTFDDEADAVEAFTREPVPAGPPQF